MRRSALPQHLLLRWVLAMILVKHMCTRSDQGDRCQSRFITDHGSSWNVILQSSGCCGLRDQMSGETHMHECGTMQPSQSGELLPGGRA